MRRRAGLLVTLWALWSLMARTALAGAALSGLTDAAAARLAAAQIVILGETHDNPDHHARQAAILERIRPAAVVYEMLTEDQAARVTPDRLGDAATLAAILDWDGSGWPDFALYYPVLAAAPQARVYGAGVPRDAALAAMDSGIAAAFGDQAAAYGLTEPLPAGQQRVREALQGAAHCDALPAELLPAMVEVQRLRDATLARVALRALDQTGGPVAVITGNGHARTDWGVPAYLARLRPEVAVFALGQSEGGRIEGRFDAVADSPPAERPDPCETFRRNGRDLD